MSWDIQTLLPAIAGERRKFSAHELSQDVFRLAASHLERKRKPAGELHDAMVEKGRPQFDGMRHAHAIALVQNVVRKVAVLVDKQISIQIAPRIRSACEFREKRSERFGIGVEELPLL